MDYIFYQDIDGQFHFKPLSSFKQEQTKWKYTATIPTADMTLHDAKFNALRHSANEFAPIENALNGMYSSEVISFDTTTGDYYSKTHVYKADKYTKL